MRIETRLLVTNCDITKQGCDVLYLIRHSAASLDTDT